MPSASRPIIITGNRLPLPSRTSGIERGSSAVVCGVPDDSSGGMAEDYHAMSRHCYATSRPHILVVFFLCAVTDAAWMPA